MAATPNPRSWHRLVPLLPLLTAVLALGGVWLAVERTVGLEFERRALARVERAAELFADQVSRQLTRRAAELELFEQDIGMQPGASTAARREALQRLKSSSPTYVWIGYVLPDGQVQAGTDGMLEGRSIADRPVFANARAGLWVGPPHPMVALKQPFAERGMLAPNEVADIGMALRTADGHLRAVLAAHLSVSAMHNLRDVALNAAPGPADLDLVLVDHEGRVLLGQSALLPGASTLQHLPLDAVQVLRSPRGDGLIVSHSAVRAPQSHLPVSWRVVALQPLDVALAPARALQRQLWLIGAAAALLLGGAGVWLSRRLSRPLVDLLDALGAQLPAGAGSLGSADVRRMAEQLRRLPARPAQLSSGERMVQQLLHDAGRMQQVLDGMPNPVLLFDPEQHLSYLNGAAERAFGWSAAEAFGRDVDEVVPPEGDGQGRAWIRSRLASESGPWVFKAETRRRDGSEFFGEWHLSRVEGAPGELLGWLLVVRDLTEGRDSERQRREQAQVLEGIVASASDAIVSVDTDGCISLFNPAAERIFGHAAAAMLGQPLDRLLPPDARQQHGADLRHFAASAITRRAMGSGLVRGLRADGSTRQLEASISQTTVAGRPVLTAILRDVTERVKSDEALAQTRAELAALAQRLLAQEKETTRRLAQVLHDGLGQTLVAARLTSDALMTALQGQWPADQGARAQRLASLVEAAQNEVRNALVDLRPPLLEDDGLAIALDSEVRSRAAGADQVRVVCQVAPSARRQRWPADVEYAAFMIAREALVNALMHAHGSEVTVELNGDEGELRLAVLDDGVGFDPASAAGPGHLGLVGMRERAQAVQARVRVQRRSGGGTMVSFDWQAPD
jgi:PAS domain S-box-containing protein